MTYYILNAALILAGCLIFYKVLLQKETFFPLNRFILLGCLALSFSLPLVPVPSQWSFRKTEVEISPLVSKQLPAAAIAAAKEKAALNPEQPIQKTTETAKPGYFDNFSITKSLIWLYWAGVIIFAINFLIQFLTLIYRAYSKEVIKDGRFRIVELTGDKAPCSFGNNIFINPEKYDWDTYNQILLHEKIHIEQGHSFDILFAELALIFQWFNPFAWLYRKAVEDNLEFLTDNELLQHNDVERESYQLSLVKVSAPHFPVSLTTNYNQSILKKRLIMMNAKKSNIHTTWKYLFIVPLMITFACFLNKPMAFGSSNTDKSIESYNLVKDLETQGVWFATIKKDKLNIQFKKEDDNSNSQNSSTFELSEFKDLPIGKTGTFTLKRDAGTITFTGKFEDNMGMGTYSFAEDKSYISYLESEGVTLKKDNSIMAFFFVNVKRSYIKMLKDNGYTNLKDGDLIALSALNVDESYIKMIKANGYANVPLKQLIPLKALDISDSYIKEIKAAGYPNVTYDQLITFKAQNFTGDFIKSSREASKTAKNGAMDISTKGDKGDKGNKDKSSDEGNGEDGDDENDNDKEFDNLIAMKALNVTATFMKTFTDLGIKAKKEDFIVIKSLGITPEYIKSIEATGFKNADIDDIAGLKSLGVTPEEIKGYKELFPNVSLSDIMGAKATGTTPEYITTMRKKGFKLSSLDKYISAKVLSITGIE